MAVFEGKLVTCDLCGESIFIKRTGVQELSGGFERNWTYEPMPNEWRQSWVKRYDTRCPNCSRRINAVIDAEIERIKGEHGGDQGRASSTSD